MRRAAPVLAVALAALVELSCAPCDRDDDPLCEVLRAVATCGFAFTPTARDRAGKEYGTAGSQIALREAAAAGIRAIALPPHATVESLADTDVKAGQKSSADYAAMRTDARRARALGMKVLVKPHLLVAGQRRGSAWAGYLAPDAGKGGWAKFFASYERYIVGVAAFAQEIEASWLCVGVEMVSATREAASRWAKLIAAARKVFHGKVTYCANWDEAEKVTFWPQLDVVAVQMFAPLRAKTTGPTQGVLDAGARKWLARYQAVARGAGKPLLLSEVGYANRVGTAAEPWKWPEDLGPQTRTARGDAEQARAYRAVLDAFGQASSVEALFWWNWFADPAYQDKANVGFSPRAKPALEVLRAACQAEGSTKAALFQGAD